MTENHAMIPRGKERENMFFVLLILFLCFDVYGYDARFYLNQEDCVESALYNMDNTTSYAVSFQESMISSQLNVFYVPIVVKDSQSIPLRDVDFQVDNEKLNLILSERSGETVIQVPITLTQIRRYYSSGTKVLIPIVMTVRVDEDTEHIVKFNLIVRTMGNLSVSPDRINWTFTGNWGECSGTVNLSYAGVLYNMDVSITSDNSFRMVSAISSDKVSYSIYNPRLRGSKNSGYEMRINDGESLDINISVDQENSLFVRAGRYADTITVQLVPTV